MVLLRKTEKIEASGVPRRRRRLHGRPDWRKKWSRSAQDEAKWRSGCLGRGLGGARGRLQTHPSEVQVVLAAISRPQPRAFLLNKETRKPLSHSLVTACKAGVGGYRVGPHHYILI